jgi:hypothetical protein
MAGAVVQLVVAVRRKAVIPHPENISFLKITGCDRTHVVLRNQFVKSWNVGNKMKEK